MVKWFLMLFLPLFPKEPMIANDQLDDEPQAAYVGSFGGGEDSFQNATQLAEDQCQHILNVIVRDNLEARTRPGADAIPAASTLPIAGMTAIYALRYFESAAHSNGQLLATGAAGGTAKFLKFEANVWSDISSLWHPNSANNRTVMTTGIDKMLLSDGATSCKIWDGATITDAGNTSKDAPLGTTILCWHTQRMFAAGISNSPDTIYASNLLAYTAGNWNTTTRSFRIGSGDGDPIMALASMQGFTMAVLKRNSIFLVATNPAIDSSTTNGFTASQVTENMAYGIGCVGRDAWCNYGNDVLFMAQDGVRSVQRMQAAAGQWQLTAPLSEPIQPYIDRINQSSWDKIVAVKHQEFALFFVPLDNSSNNNYVLVWNGRLGRWMGAFQQEANNTWQANSVCVSRFGGATRLVWGDSSGYVNQWKDYSSTTDDSTYTDNGKGYKTQVWTKSFQFGDPIVNKSAYTTIIRFSSGNAAVSVSWIGDSAQQQIWDGQFEPTGDILGVNNLPFLLQATTPYTLQQPIRGNVQFNEGFLRCETQSGWIAVRNISILAFINPLTEA